MIDTLLKMSATGTAVICVVMLLRLFLRCAPKIFSYALWLIVLFRLLCPVSVALPVSVFNLVPSARAGITEQLSMQEHLGEMDVTLSESFEGADVQTGALPTDPAAEKSPGSEHLRGSQDAMEVTSLWSWKLVAFVIWLLGVCMMLVYAIVSILHLHKRLKYASLDRENIYLLDGISSPFVAGVLRPNIYLPYGLGENEKTYILLHEQTHIRRGDPLFRVLAYMALALHWFNPFVWVAFFLSGRDMEMSCDEMVLRRLGSKIKCDYSDSLLAMAQGKRAIGFTPLAFGEGDTGKRIKNVLNYKKTTLQVVMVGVLVVALAGIALGADAVDDVAEHSQAKDADALAGQALPETTGDFAEGQDVQPVPVDTTQADELTMEKFLTASFDIMDEISFELPKGLTLEDYHADVGALGGRLFSPNVNEGGEGTPAEWLASGMVSRYTQANVLEWKDGVIADVHDMSNHTMYETQGKKVYDLDAPAVLASVRHDLYTAAEMEEMDVKGISYEQACDYWHLYIAREGEAYGYVISLSQKNFTVDDMMELAKSVRLTGRTAGEEASGGNVPEQNTPADSAVVATLSVRTISRSARCIDNYVSPDDDWEKNYGRDLTFADDCKYYINSSRTTMDAKVVSFSRFADAIEAGDPILNKPCIVELHNDDNLVHEIILISERYRYGVTYTAIPNDGVFDGFYEDPMVLYPDFYRSFKLVRTEHMDIATSPGDETIEIYTGVADGGSHGQVFIRDADGKLFYHYAVNDSGMCWKNIYAGYIDGGGDPYLLELNLENRDTSGEYSFYVYSLGAENGSFTQIAGSRIEWNQNGSLIYDSDEMLMFFHELGHYLNTSHLLVGMEDLKIRTDPVCDEDHYTYANFAPTCFPDPYKGMDVR